MFSAAATNLILGKIFGQFNAKWTYILCVLLFELGSAICGAAPSIDALIIGRAICGVAGSVILLDWIRVDLTPKSTPYSK
jgi:MFS family permease